MAKIHLLTPEISNKIAAGEVVERPASVVKELVENSIDAGADKITVEIKNGGISLISISDNGCGMASEDAQIAFLRHATSKIEKEEDLDAIYTLGFRGEALSSIGAVSNAVIYTKRREDEFGTVVSCEGGEIIASDEGGMSDGTTVVIRNLFYNTPARMKFLKKDATEAGYITDVITRFVLSHPDISFKLIKNGKQIICSSGDGSIKNAVYAVYGRDFANSLIVVDYNSEGVSVKGVIGKSTLARPNRTFQSFFVNKRYIKSPMIVRALEEAYKNQIMIGKFPLAILNIEINPAQIDINVHPTKLEVKFSEDKKVYDCIYYGVKSALYSIDTPKVQEKPVHDPRVNPFILAKEEKTEKVIPMPNEQGGAKTVIKEEPKEEVKATIPKKEETKQAPSIKEETPKSVVEIKEDPLAKFIKKEISNTPVFSSPELKLEVVPQKEKPSVSAQIEIEQSDFKDIKKAEPSNPIRIVGQIFDTYIIAQNGREMLMIDQHAAHERIKYEQLLRNIKSKEIYPQILLEPVIIKLSGTEKAEFENSINVFEELGFEAEGFGENEIIVRATPPDVEWSDVEDLFLELLSQVGASKKELIGARLERMTYTIACKAAIKANMRLGIKEMESLVKEVLSLENINTCPHGRPITVVMTQRELEKMFKRIV